VTHGEGRVGVLTSLWSARVQMWRRRKTGQLWGRMGSVVAPGVGVTEASRPVLAGRGSCGARFQSHEEQ
jgi:hypothetical protein